MTPPPSAPPTTAAPRSLPASAPPAPAGFPGPFDHPTMLTRAEIDALHDVAAQLPGRGRIVEAGCFLGGSTRAILAGLDARADQRSTVISHDRFRVERDSQLLYLRHMQHGDSFRSLHTRLMAPWAHRIDVREGSIPENQDPHQRKALYPEREPIELLFLDFARTPALHRTALATWAAHLTTGGVLFEQDLQYPLCHWIALHAFILRDALQPTLSVEDSGSCVFRLREPLAERLPLVLDDPVENMPPDRIASSWNDARDWFALAGWTTVAHACPAYRMNHLAANGFYREADAAARDMLDGREPITAYGLRPTIDEWLNRLDHTAASDPHTAAFLKTLTDLKAAGAERVIHAELRRQTERADWYRKRLWRNVERRLLDQRLHRIALFGAGRHTESLLAESWPTSSELHLVAVLDDRPTRAHIAGVPIRPADEPPTNIDAVVLSSDAHEPALLASARRRQANSPPWNRLQIVAPYASDA